MRQIVYDGLVEVQLGPAVKRSVSNDWGQVSRVVAATIAFVAVAQPFSAFQPRGFVTSTFRDGWRGQQLECLTAKPFPASEQQFNAFQPEGAIKSTFPDGWRGQQLDCKFATPFPAAAQIYASQLQLLGNVPSPVTPLGRGEFSSAISTGRAIIYQAGVSPEVTNPQAIPSPLPLDYKFATPVSASTQQFSAFQPRGFVQSSFSDGWRGSLDYRFGSAVPVGVQPFSPTPVPGQDQPVFGWWRQAETRVAAPLLAALRENFASLSLVAQAAAAVPSADFPALFAKPLSPGLAQTDSFQPPPTTVAPSVPRGFSGFQPDRFAAPFPAAAQQYYSFAPYIAAAAANGVRDPGSFSAVLWRAPIIYQAGVSPLKPPAVAATPSVLGWSSGSPAVAQFAISLGDGGDLAGFVNFQPQGWWSDFPALFAKPLSPALARTDSFQAPLTTVIVAAPQGWSGSRPERFATPFPAAAQQYYSFTPYIAPPAANGVGDPGPFNSVLWRAPIVYQAGVSPLTAQAAAPAAPKGWWVDLPPALAKPFPAAAQQYETTARGQIASPVTPNGWSGHQFDYRFAKPVAAATQQFDVFVGPLSTVIANGIGYPGQFSAVLWRAPIVYQAGVSPLTSQALPPPKGWWVDLPPSFARPFPAAAQQYETTARGQIASPVTPHGWFGFRFDYRFSVPYPATAQPFSVVAQLFLPTAANVIGNPGQFSSVISLPPIIYQAGVLPLAPPAAVKPPVVEPPPGGGDWPHRHKKPKVRPVWDRRPDADRAPEPKPHPAPSVRAPVEDKPPGAPSDPTGLRRLLAPDLPQLAVAPPTKIAKRPSAAVTATLNDADDEAVALRGVSAVALGIDADDGATALAHVVVAAVVDTIDQADESITGRVTARLAADEENDSVSTQSVSDDDIALSLLFGDNDDEIALALLLGDDARNED